MPWLFVSQLEAALCEPLVNGEARPGEPWTRATMWIAVAPKKCRVRGELQFARNEMRWRELNAA
jgi:hypothetical protein